jgi:putative transcriptional regulator
MVHFGKRLRRLRGDRSQKEVASELGMPQTTLSTLENQDAVPRGEVLEKLAQYYGVPVTYFYPSNSVKVTPTAKTWLKKLGDSTEGRDTVAMHGAPDLDEETKEKIARKIRQKLAETTHKH